jgi:hypothetical protein
MTASFTEQMLTIYTHLGMLSRGILSLSAFYSPRRKLPVMRGLDPRICRWREMAGSSPAMT